MDLAYSAFNYLLLIRHTILLGYYSEGQVLLRAVHERVARSVLFNHDARQAEQYLTGERMKQEDVDREVARLMKGAAQDVVLSRLRSPYKHLSMPSHANVQASALRVGTTTPHERAGHQPVGGLLSVRHGRLELMLALGHLPECLEVMGAIVKDESGSWHRQFRDLKTACDRLYDDNVPPE